MLWLFYIFSFRYLFCQLCQTNLLFCFDVLTFLILLCQMNTFTFTLCFHSPMKLRHIVFSGWYCLSSHLSSYHLEVDFASCEILIGLVSHTPAHWKWIDDWKSIFSFFHWGQQGLYLLCQRAFVQLVETTQCCKICHYRLISEKDHCHLALQA